MRFTIRITLIAIVLSCALGIQGCRSRVSARPVDRVKAELVLLGESHRPVSGQIVLRIGIPSEVSRSPHIWGFGGC